jgi:hypothetical protein
MKLEHFTRVIRDAWKSIEQERINSLIATMPDRIKELKKNKGRATHY